MSKTSTTAKQKWLDKHYAAITIRLPKEIVAAFRAKTQQNGDSQVGIMRNAIENYIKKDPSQPKPEGE